MRAEEQGLTSAEAERRLAEYGENTLFQPPKVQFVSVVKDALTEPMILLLFVVGFLYSLSGELSDFITIVAIILAVISVEVWNEYRAEKSIAALSQLSAPTTRVMRDGMLSTINTAHVVPGDVLFLTMGTRISADAHVTRSLSLTIDESSLTGESFPQERGTTDDVYAATLAVGGEGTAVAFATGAATKLFGISARAEEIKPPKTPLQLEMNSLTKVLVVVAIAFSVLIPLLGILRGQNLYQMILTGLALAFATVPEEFPIIITSILGLGAYQLSKHGFLVKKIKAAEVLGDATVILTDKTGTITENKMQVVSVFSLTSEKDMLTAAVGALPELPTSATDAAINKWGLRDGALQPGSLIRERSFDSERKTRSSLRISNDVAYLYNERCSGRGTRPHHKQRWFI